MNKLALLFLLCLASFRGLATGFYPSSIAGPLDSLSSTLPTECPGVPAHSYTAVVTMCPVSSPTPAAGVPMNIDWYFNGSIVYSQTTTFTSTAAVVISLPAAMFTYPTTPGTYSLYAKITWSAPFNSPCAAPGSRQVTGSSSPVTITTGTAPITGSKFICVGFSQTLADASPGGNFSSTSPLVTVTTTGVVTGVAVGTAVISYNGSGCDGVATVVTVSTTPPPILPSPLTLCQGATMFLTDSMAGGTWSATGATSSIDPASGFVFGSAVGTATVTYQLSATCRRTAVLTINAMPTAFTGSLVVCTGTTTTLGSTPAGGVWSSDATPIATATTIGTGLQGAIQGVTAGTANISYTRLGCTATDIVTVQQSPAAITGPSYVCNAPGTITLSNSVPGGTWSSSNAAVASVVSTSGVVSGVAATAPSTATISYTVSICAPVTKVVTVTVPPTAITGNTPVCVNKTITLGDGVAGGTWSTSSANITINSTTGVVLAVSSGTAVVTYSIGSNCNTTAVVTINPLPNAISGGPTVCLGFTVSLTNAGGGTWASSNANITIGATNGAAFGAALGTATITYTLPTGCQATMPMTVNPLPSAITGASAMCETQVITLSNAASGTWSASNANASVTTATVTAMPVTGAIAGTSTITFTLSTGCYTTKPVTVNALPTAYLVSGGGSYCTGGSGVAISLAGSAVGVNYQVYQGSVPYGSPMAGSGGILTLGTAFTAAGTYTVRATNTATGCVNNMTGSATVTIDVPVTPLVSMANSAGSDTLCGGLPVTFTATPVNGGSVPAYQWRVNGSPVGTSSPNYVYMPANGDVVSVTLTSSYSCLTAPTAVATHTLTVLPSDLPSVTTSVVPGTTVCAGTMVTFSAIGVNGGTAPTFRWTKNGTNVATGPTYTFMPANGDVIYVMMRSSATCNLVDSAFSPTTTITVTTPGTAPAVSITANPGLTIASGTSDTLTATAFGAGTAPTYQWYVNGMLIAGATNATFVSNTFANHDSVTCKVTSSNTCRETGAKSVIITVKGGGNNVGVADLNTTTNVAILPNPNNGNFRIAGEWGAASEVVRVQMTDLVGKVVYSATMTTDAGRISGEVSMTTLPAGVYMLSLHGDSGNKVIRIVKE